MFELSVACKYLIPRRRQLSVSIISLISMLVIALVVWLIVVFFSVTDGLEKNWVNKLTALTAPVRITPTDAYYNSYYYLIDGISDRSNYGHKTIREKKEALAVDPYVPDSDEEVPTSWPEPDRNADHSLKDLVKLVYSSLDEIHGVPGLYGEDFELTGTHIQLDLIRRTTVLNANNIYGGTQQSTLSYPAYLGNFEPSNQSLKNTLIPIEMSDLNNLLNLIGIARSESTELGDDSSSPFSVSRVQEKLKSFFSTIAINALKPRSMGWNIPRTLLPTNAEWKVYAILKDQRIVRLIVPGDLNQIPILEKTLEEQGLITLPALAKIHDGTISVTLIDHTTKQTTLSSFRYPLTLAGGTSFKAQIEPHSLEKAKRLDDIRFKIQLSIQDSLIEGTVPYRGLEIAQAEIHTEPGQNSPSWLHSIASEQGTLQFQLPTDPIIGEGVLLPKSFRDAGVLIGDRGSLSYLSPTVSTLQEQLIPIYVAGFYDPGIIPIGGKFILANREITSLIRSAHQQEDKSALTNGINVRFPRLEDADAVKAQLLKSLKGKGINRYWNVETFREYEFTQAIMRELQSQKNLFMLIAIVIIIVACSNIISMLVILVNDKKLEIGILRSMGATSQSIAFIFGLSGAIIGILGSAIGITAAVVTLYHLDTLVSLLSALQGHEMFSSNLYGKVLPSELSLEALTFVCGATVCISLLAGIVPAIKACLLRPSQILRSGGG